MRRYGNGWSSVAGAGAVAAETNVSPGGHVTAPASALTTSTDRIVPRAVLTHGGRSNAVLQRGRIAIDEPRFAVVVVHRERATVGEVVAVRLHRLGGEQVALQTHRRLPLEQRQRIRQGEQDRVPPTVGPLQERPSVGDVRGDAGVVVGAVGMCPSDVEEVAVDLHGIDGCRAAGEGDGDVVARAGADHQDGARRVGGRCARRRSRTAGCRPRANCSQVGIPLTSATTPPESAIGVVCTL